MLEAHGTATCRVRLPSSGAPALATQNRCHPSPLLAAPTRQQCVAVTYPFIVPHIPNCGAGTTQIGATRTSEQPRRVVPHQSERRARCLSTRSSRSFQRQIGAPNRCHPNLWCTSSRPTAASASTPSPAARAAIRSRSPPPQPARPPLEQPAGQRRRRRHHASPRQQRPRPERPRQPAAARHRLSGHLSRPAAQHDREAHSIRSTFGLAPGLLLRRWRQGRQGPGPHPPPASRATMCIGRCMEIS
jgi:hypothetical protein